MAQNQSNTIGEKIRAVLKEQRRSAIWLAEQLNCNRVNVYDIFERPNIDCELLLRISVALRYDFFAEYTAEYKELVEKNVK